MAPSEFVRKSGREYRTLQEIERRLTDSLANSLGWTKLVPTFEHLRAHMIKLFALEDTEGFLHTVIIERPDKAREAARFRAEHHALANHAADVLTSLRAASSANDSKAGERVGAEIRAMLAELRRHEEGEGAFVQALFSDDISAHD